MVKIVGISGSPRNEATCYSVKEALKAAEATGDVVTEFFSLKAKKINPCIHCDKCVRDKSPICTLWNDDLTPLLPIIEEADGIILGSPVYGMGMTPQMCTLLSRFRGTYVILDKEPDHYAKMAGGAIAVGGTRNGGQENVINGLYGFFNTHGITPANGALCTYSGACVWTNNKNAAGAAEDEDGMKHCRRIGEKVAKLAKALKDSKEF